ncbi:MAG: NERD domain-containing protein [Bacillaceae bacterium]|nr:NERD domain-containing protein [Bacillaceae bacterium]
MIVKERKKPIYLQQLEALYRRTLDSHPKKLMIKDALSRHLIGFKGELAIDFPLSFLAKERYMVLHGIRLNDGHYHFQIDTLILSQRFFLIVEIKNYSGSIYFDEQFHQMIQTYEQEEKAYPNPLLQIKRQEIQLKKWLIQNQVSPPPIESLVVFTNPYTIIRSTSHYLTNKVIRSEYLPTKMKEFERVYSKDVLTNECVKKS